MEPYEISLFSGIAPADAAAMLPCLLAETRRYPRGSVIWRAGESTSRIGAVLEGTVELVREDYWGNRSLLARIAPGALFGEVYACLPGRPLGVQVQAAADCTVLFLDAKKAMTGCGTACPHHTALTRNLIAALAEKSCYLTRKADLLSRRTTREKLLAYLSDLAQQQGGRTLTLPLNRQQLADFLAVDRSAMSAALHAMAREGILAIDRRRITLLQVEEESK